MEFVRLARMLKGIFLLIMLKGDYCREVCGKGRVISDKLECDDGNSINGDGCSD